MSTTFVITISAVDRATATIRAVNNAMSRAVRPLVNLGRAGKNLSKAMGLDKIGANLARMGELVGDIGKRIGRLAAPMLALFGVGSVAAVSAMVSEFGRFNQRLEITSTGLKVSATQLQLLRGQARLMGLENEALDSSLDSLGRTMQDALYGRNQEALVIMNRLGLRIHHTKEGAIDTTRAFEDLADAISRIKNPAVQSLVAGMMGASQMLPVLRLTKQQREERRKLLEEYRGPRTDEAIQKAAAFQQRLLLLREAMGGTRDAIADSLLPVLTPMVDKFSKWLVVNRELISTRVSNFVEGFAKSLEKIDFNKVLDGIGGFLKGIQSVVDFMGGWQNTIIAVAVAMNAHLILSTVLLGKELVALGVNIYDSAIPTLIGMEAALGGSNYAALGLMGTLGSLLAKLTLLGAVGYGSYKLAGMLGATSFGERLGEDAYRMTHNVNAEDARIRGTPGGGATRAPLVGRSSSGADSLARIQDLFSAQAEKTMKLEVDFRGAPPGTTARATVDGRTVPVRIGMAMPMTNHP